MDSILTLDQIALNAWSPFQQIFFEGWVLRFADGFTKRANSANLISPIDTDPAALTEYVECQYRARNLPPLFRIIDHPLAKPIDEYLAKRNYSVLDRTLVMTCPIATFRAQDNEPIAIQSVDANTWFACYHALNQDRAPSPAHLHILQNIVPPYLFAVLNKANSTVACGIGVLERGYFGLFEIITHPAARRQGHATKLISGMVNWARQRGAHTLYLQVVETNLPARNLYQKLGFTDAYAYWYRV
ncbi:MAG TPA: GNAT family N-acetyltransferase [Anaerolineae bacterium]|nr:GNAT family N-acetyltransferase [Anaerolineae bacterium]